MFQCIQIFKFIFDTEKNNSQFFTFIAIVEVNYHNSFTLLLQLFLLFIVRVIYHLRKLFILI